jgi:hypothetical protein
LGKSIGIIEHEHGRFKANIVLAKVLPVFLFTPLKSHNLVATATAYGLFSYECQYICTYSARQYARSLRAIVGAGLRVGMVRH